MPAERFSPDDPREWMNRARSNLAKARSGFEIPEVYLDDLCFDAQQAAEKAIKAILIQLGVRFPYVHDLAQLLALVEEAGQVPPQTVRQAAGLAEYAVAGRYPGPSEPVTIQEYHEAIALAEAVVSWAEGIMRGKSENHQ